MKKILLILAIAALAACSNNRPPDEDDTFMSFDSYRVESGSSTSYWYVKEKFGVWFYFSSPVEITHGSQVTSWSRSVTPPREITSSGSTQLPPDEVKISELPMDLQWELGY